MEISTRFPNISNSRFVKHHRPLGDPDVALAAPDNLKMIFYTEFPEHHPQHRPFLRSLVFAAPNFGPHNSVQHSILGHWDSLEAFVFILFLHSDRRNKCIISDLLSLIPKLLCSYQH